jgi:hypothetical protein
MKKKCGELSQGVFCSNLGTGIHISSIKKKIHEGK